MKEKAYVGDAVFTLQEQEELNQEQLAFDLNVSPGMISHYKNNRRPMHQEVAEQSIKIYDNPHYRMELVHEFSDGITPPRLNGTALIQSHLAFKERLKKEVREVFALLKLDKTIEILTTPLEACTAADLEEIDRLIKELDDMEIYTANLKASLLTEYKRSQKKISDDQQKKYIASKLVRH